MVKADIKRDYYADLDLPPNADLEDVKKQFRILAKRYHPDRNPGHEVEAVPKFQAVQAAHEILIDPVEKKKYDEGRARLNAKQAQTSQTYTAPFSPDPYGFARPPAPKPPGSTPQNFPPPPKPRDKRPQFSMPNPKPTSTSADKYAAWARTVPDPRDRPRYDAATSAEAARGFSNMRQTQSNPQAPTRSTRQHPTAPRPPSAADNFHVPSGTSGAFPGLSRTQSARKPTGYNTAPYGSDEPQAPRSAYSYVRGDRSQAPPPNIHVPEPQSTRAPPVTRPRPAVSPLRHTRSSDYDMRSNQPGSSRPSARYATTGGEKTNVHGDGVRRSSSVRNSPVDPEWEEDRGPFGRPTASRHEHVPRHRSASPKVTSNGRNTTYASSSSSESDDEWGTIHNRPKATPKSRSKPGTTPTFQAFADNDPALTGQFPNTNYTKVVNDGQHYYPPPGSKDHTRNPWSTTVSPDAEVPGHNFAGYGGNTDGPNHDPQMSQPQSTFVPSEWHDKVTSDNFQPTDTHVRKSPSKFNRSTNKPTTRGRGLSRAGDGETGSSSESSTSRTREHRDSKASEDARAKANAFQPPKLPQDWAARTRQNPEKLANGSQQRKDGKPHVDSQDPAYVVVEEDVEPMDIDDSPPSNGNGVHQPSTNGASRNPTAESSRWSSKRSSMSGVDLREFTQHAPFAPSATGLKGMDDIAASLPFESRAEAKVDLDRQNSANRNRLLDMPRPPRTIEPPSEDRLTEENFIRYTKNMSAYMLEWNKFNAKMLEHFRHRQDQVCGHMSTNWITMHSDGPDAHAAAAQIESSSVAAGYATYMQWLEDDAKCRAWWDEAYDKHMASLRELGRIREKAKRSLRK
ncbi:hypothetical protein PV10_02510 [Exophiala mesophila]|uniref:J domain-containing protein n=1 Tax=Exophiala mesophila TaxID=212818 RepID=A0A0D2A6X1_EXOME|nr:uncharacterized protein PV10_02510 [Exophiala mesophila]KIV94778.1 hypothetical protein PV10_02510 [Exophiala mesophila]